MNLNQLRSFCAIVAEGNLSRAGERLGLTQPTISGQLQALEQDLGVRLLERSAHGIFLTQAGEVFHPYAREVLDRLERGLQAVDEIQGLQRGRVDLVASSAPGHYLLPGLLAAFKVERPGLRVRLTVTNSQEARLGVRDGRYELGFVGERARDERLTFEEVAQDRLLVAMRPGHPLAEAESISVEDLRSARLIVREAGSATRRTLEEALGRSAGFLGGDHAWMELHSAEAVKSALLAADALSVVSEWTVRREVADGALVTRPLAGADLRRSFYAIRRTHGCLSLATEEFLRFLCEKLRQ